MGPCQQCGRVAELDDDGLCAVCSPDEDAEEARAFVRVYDPRR